MRPPRRRRSRLCVLNGAAWVPRWCWEQCGPPPTPRPPLRNAFNAIVLPWAGTYVDGIADYGDDPLMGDDTDPDSTTYYSGDKLHPNTAGHERGALTFIPAVDAVAA